MSKKLILSPIPAVMLARRMVLAAVLVPGLAFAGPSGGSVAAGQIGITTPNAATTVINETSQSAIINWQQFNIAGNESVIFNQPTASAVVLNRVVGGSPSEILGNLTANGRIFIVNPQGVLFGSGAQVDVGALVASTANISDQDFLAGRYVFSGGTTAPVSNAGNITAAPHGYVVLAGDYVSNSGIIQARLGTVALASGSAMTLDMNGDGLVGLSVDQAALDSRAGVANLGTLAAQGGTVIMTARVAQDLASTAVNNSGVVNASGIDEQGGDIYLTAQGGDITNSGSLNASGGGAQNGGDIEVRGDGNVLLAAGSSIDASGASGGTLHAVAGQLLTLQQGAGTTVANTASSGNGGFAELSGHEVRLRDVVDLGRRGQLLIDPVGDLTIGPDGDITPNALGGMLASGGHGSTVTIAASDGITLDGSIDGRNGGNGASLVLGIGSLSNCSNDACTSGSGFTAGGTSSSFINFTSSIDTIAVDGDLTLNAGNGSISVGNLLVGGAANLFGGGDIRFGNVNAARLWVDGGGNITIPGVVNVGDLTVESDNGNIDLTGSNIVVGTGQAVAGGDPNLLSALSGSGLGPTSPKPNAAFISDNGVLTLGNSLTMRGDYLYFEGQNIFNPNVILLHSGGPLFFQELFTTSGVALNGLTFYATLAENYLSNNQPRNNVDSLSPRVASPGPVLTLAFGSSSTTESIDTGASATSPLDVHDTTTNFIFATNSPGAITNEQYILTQGQIATVLNGQFQIVTPEANPPVTPTPPSGSNPGGPSTTPQLETSNAANAVSSDVSNQNSQTSNPNPDSGIGNWLNGNPDPVERHEDNGINGKNCGI